MAIGSLRRRARVRLARGAGLQRTTRCARRATMCLVNAAVISHDCPAASRPCNAQEDIMRVGKCLLTLATLAAASLSVVQAEPLTIRHSYVVPVANWTPLLPVKKDLARHWDKSYVLQATRYEGTPPMITALANNELDIAVLAYSTLGLAIQNAGLTDLRVIADEFQDGAPGYFS